MLTKSAFTRLCRARDLLRETHDRPLSIEEVAADAGVSPFHFIPATAFEVDDLEKEFKRLRGMDVVFTQAPTRMGPVTIAVCSDTCGNLIQLYQPA